MSGIVILGGGIVVGLTWNRTDVASVTVPVQLLLPAAWFALLLVALASGVLLVPRLSNWWIVGIVAISLLILMAVTFGFKDRQLTIRLPAFWVIQFLAIALIGYILSGQFDKIKVRIFTLVGMAILAALLITIGRNERVNIATQAADNAYLQLRQITEEVEDSRNTPAARALVTELCLLSGQCEDDEAARALVAELCVLSDQCEDAGEARGADDADDVDDADEATEEIDLERCLPGWTFQAFEEWADAASIDRQVAAVSALARCELAAFEPGSVSESGGEGEQSDVVLSADSEAPDDAEARIEEGNRTQAAIDVRLAVTEAIATQRTEVNLIETLSAGADGILASVSGPNEFAEFRFSGATWLVLLALTLFWYRRLEIRAGSHGLGPVEIAYEKEAHSGHGEGDSGTSPDPDELNGPETGHAVFKQSVVQNVPEPGAVPGAQALAPVGDLISSTDVPNKWLASGFVEAIRSILATRGGYTVLYSAHQEPSLGSDSRDGGRADGTYVVFVRLRDTQSGTQQGAMRFESEFLAEAAQMAGYWVAGWIINRSRYVPEWAVWSERDAYAFYNLQWRQGDDLPLQAHGVVDPDRIQNSTNALILAQRAYAYQISPQQNPGAAAEGSGPYTLNALEDFARAAYHQPRYPVARYRRAVALSALMHRDVELKKVYMPRRAGDAKPSKPRLIHLFCDLIGYGRGSDDHSAERKNLNEWIDRALRTGVFPPEMRRAMLKLSYAWLVECEQAFAAKAVARLRPSEGKFWRDFSRTGNGTDWITLVRVSQQIVRLRLDERGLRSLGGGNVNWQPDLDELEKLERIADDPKSHWQISYNLGCFYALRAEQTRVEGGAADGDIQTAFDWLERCLDRRYSGQLVREWVARDPDLHELRDKTQEHPEFEESWERWRLRVSPMPVQIRQGDRSSAVRRLQQNLNHVAVSEPEGRQPESASVVLQPEPRSTRRWYTAAIRAASRHRRESVAPAERRPSALEEDGVFGPRTKRAVEDFQYHNHLRVTGYPDLTMLARLEDLAEATLSGATAPAGPADSGPPTPPARESSLGESASSMEPVAASHGPSA